MERLTFTTPPTAKNRTISGYAALHNSLVQRYDQYGRGYQMKLLDTAFVKSINSDIVCCLNHDTGRIMGRTSAGNLTLRLDSKGLYFENQLLPTSANRDLETEIEAGLWQGCSIGFEVMADEWHDGQDGAEPVRLVSDANLFELGPNSIPADNRTTLDLHSVQFRPEIKPHSTEAKRLWLEMLERQRR